MDHFSEQAPTYEEAVEKVRQKYGEQARIYARERRVIRGLFGRKKGEVVHVSGYILAGQPEDTEDEAGSSGYGELLQQLRGMEKRLAEQGGRMQKSRGEEHAEQLLYDNDFSRDFIGYALEMLRTGLTEEDLRDHQQVELYILRLISEEFLIQSETALSLPRVFGIIGPTGVGKTTTIAKLAARCSLDPRMKRRGTVRIVTIDSFRIGAREQIGNYGNLMDIPVDTVETAEELGSCLQKAGEGDLLLIDTIGKSPRDNQTLQEMQEILSVCGEDAYWSLALAASTKERDLEFAAQRFEPFGYQSLILTKLDETDRIGNLVSMLHRQRKPILYATTGQRVPTDLVIPKTEDFLKKLQGFSVDLDEFTSSL